MNENSLIGLVRLCHGVYSKKLQYYDKINAYYYGNTDSLANFKPMPGRSNLKPRTNFIQKLVDEEASYSFGNKITYTSKDNNREVINDIDYILSGYKADYDINLGIELIKYGVCYEINYRKNGKFKSKTVTPLNGYMFLDEDDDPVCFLHIYKKKFDTKEYIDVYTNRNIYHFDSSFKEISKPTPHFFGIVPVGIGMIGGNSYNDDRGYIEGDKTIYRTIKTLQDAFETNLGDSASEVSDIRNAILKVFNIALEDELDEKGNPTGKKKEPILRNNIIMYLNGEGESKPDAEWLIKNINDAFIRNTRNDIKDLMYVLTSHIDSNEKLQSNLSGVALRSRLQSLESKCSNNAKAFENILRIRLQCMFNYLAMTKGKKYDVNLIEIKFTPNVPVDEDRIADRISKIPHDVVSNETKRSWLASVSNPVSEQLKIDEENKKSMEGFIDLDKEGGIDEAE
ncbi:phage portal protein [Clostridium sp.]|uniref:phage portal protein n=1 Tax=Clostridium sp. TaxID=1506 RepID=UPI00260C46EB|nr:phage portal protein [Clostridium sp.]